MIPTIRAFIVGNSGSGKTTGAWRWYLSRFPRVIILDQTGEWDERTDVTANTLPELVSAIRELAQEGKRWSVSYTLLDGRFSDLVSWLVPVPNVDRSPVITLGGAVLLVDEVDILAPQGAPIEVRNLYRRSRHVGLSIVSATQRPANVSREVSAQSTQVLAYRLREPRDRDYVADLMRWDSGQVQQWLAWTQQHPHGAAWKDLQTGRLLWIPESGNPNDRQSESAQTPQTPQPTSSPVQQGAVQELAQSRESLQESPNKVSEDAPESAVSNRDNE